MFRFPFSKSSYKINAVFICIIQCSAMSYTIINISFKNSVRYYWYPKFACNPTFLCYFHRLYQWRRVPAWGCFISDFVQIIVQTVFKLLDADSVYTFWSCVCYTYLYTFSTLPFGIHIDLFSLWTLTFLLFHKWSCSCEEPISPYLECLGRLCIFSAYFRYWLVGGKWFKC